MQREERQTWEGRWWVNTWKHFLIELMSWRLQSVKPSASMHPFQRMVRAGPRLLPWGPPDASVVAFGAENRGACTLKSDCPVLAVGSHRVLLFLCLFEKIEITVKGFTKWLLSCFSCFTRARAAKWLAIPVSRKHPSERERYHRNSTCLYL